MVVRLNCAAIDAELQRLDVFSIAMDAFFQFTWNNFLHTTVEQIVDAGMQHSGVGQRIQTVGEARLPEDLEPLAARRLWPQRGPRQEKIKNRCQLVNFCRDAGSV